MMAEACQMLSTGCKKHIKPNDLYFYFLNTNSCRLFQLSIEIRIKCSSANHEDIQVSIIQCLIKQLLNHICKWHNRAIYMSENMPGLK